MNTGLVGAEVLSALPVKTEGWTYSSTDCPTDLSFRTSSFYLINMQKLFFSSALLPASVHHVSPSNESVLYPGVR